MAKKARGLTKSLHSTEHRALCALLLAGRQKAELTQQTVAKRLKRPQCSGDDHGLFRRARETRRERKHTQHAS